MSRSADPGLRAWRRDAAQARRRPARPSSGRHCSGQAPGTGWRASRSTRHSGSLRWAWFRSVRTCWDRKARRLLRRSGPHSPYICLHLRGFNRQAGDRSLWRPLMGHATLEVTAMALIGFRGGRPKGDDRGDGRLRMGLPASTGAAHAAFGEPVVVDRRCEVLRAGAPAPLARRRLLPALRERRGRPPWPG